MAAAEKSVGGAYGMAVVGLLLGIVGMQRFYVRRYVSATLMTAVFIAGLFLLTWELIVGYYALLNQVTGALAALDGGTPQLGAVPDISSVGRPSDAALLYGKIAGGVGIAWWAVDLLLIPKMVREFNAEWGR